MAKSVPTSTAPWHASSLHFSPPWAYLTSHTCFLPSSHPSHATNSSSSASYSQWLWSCSTFLQLSFAESPPAETLTQKCISLYQSSTTSIPTHQTSIFSPLDSFSFPHQQALWFVHSHYSFPNQLFLLDSSVPQILHPILNQTPST